MKWLDRDLITGPYLLLATTEEQFRAGFAHCEIPAHKQPDLWIRPGMDALATYMDNPKGELVCIVSIRAREGITPIQVAALLVHEAVHVWQEFRFRIGELEPPREFEAYCIQSIAQRLMQAYADQLPV
jgi:hypothetical protein